MPQLEYFKIYRERIDDGGGILSGAAMSNGGMYPDGAVNERITMLRFAVVLLIILPVTLFATPSDFDLICYNVSVPVLLSEIFIFPRACIITL